MVCVVEMMFISAAFTRVGLFSIAWGRQMRLVFSERVNTADAGR
jgi:hypothetical protein